MKKIDALYFQEARELSDEMFSFIANFGVPDFLTAEGMTDQNGVLEVPKLAGYYCSDIACTIKKIEQLYAMKAQEIYCEYRPQEKYAFVVNI